MTSKSARRSAQKDNSGGQQLALVSLNVLTVGSVVKTNMELIFVYLNVIWTSLKSFGPLIKANVSVTALPDL